MVVMETISFRPEVLSHAVFILMIGKIITDTVKYLQGTRHMLIPHLAVTDVHYVHFWLRFTFRPAHLSSVDRCSWKSGARNWSKKMPKQQILLNIRYYSVPRPKCPKPENISSISWNICPNSCGSWMCIPLGPKLNPNLSTSSNLSSW